jgi:isopentenyl diphosphate isomerase/L-lactate dehydrogenase-like FMN-dependent dehydrogenase
MAAVQVNGRVPVLFGGDIRSGMDLAKALYPSASACLIGRLYLYSLAFASQERRGSAAHSRRRTRQYPCLLGCADLEP